MVKNTNGRLSLIVLQGTQLDDTTLKRMISVLEKRIARNQEMRIKFPDQPEK